jgi:hypothetical protein
MNWMIVLKQTDDPGNVDMAANAVAQENARRQKAAADEAQRTANARARNQQQNTVTSNLPASVQNIIKPQEQPKQFNPATAEARTVGGKQLTPDVINRINQDPNAQMAVYDQYVREQNKRMPFGDARLKDIPIVGGFASGYAGGRNIGDIRVRDAVRGGAEKFAGSRAGKILGKVGSKIPGVRNIRSNLQAQAPSPQEFTNVTGINLPKTLQESDPEKLQQYAEESEKLRDENQKQLEERQKQLEMDVSRETDPEKKEQLRQQFQDSTKIQQEQLNQQLRDIEARKVRSTNLESVVSGRTENPETSAAGRARQAVSEGRARPNEQLDPRSTSQGWFQQMYGNMLSSGKSPAAVAAAQARAGKRIEQAQQRRNKT